MLVRFPAAERLLQVDLDLQEILYGSAVPATLTTDTLRFVAPHDPFSTGVAGMTIDEIRNEIKKATEAIAVGEVEPRRRHPAETETSRSPSSNYSG